MESPQSGRNPGAGPDAGEERIRWWLSIAEEAPYAIVPYRPDRIFPNRRARRILGGIDEALGLEGLSERLTWPSGQRFSSADLGALAARAVDRPWLDLVLEREGDGKVPVLMRGGPAPFLHEKGGILAIEEVASMSVFEEARSEWATVVTHDLKQPLTVISTYAALVERETSESGVRSKARHIMDSTATLSRMIGDLTDAIRMESRTMEVHERRIDLSELLHRAGERARKSFGDRPLQVQLQDDHLPVDADPDRIEQLISNLLRNAKKYGYPGTAVELGAKRHGADAVVWVENEGEGIDPRDLPRLFERFYRGEKARRGGISGLGLGLYIAKGLVEMQGGRIWAESIPGKLTRISFSLPLVLEG